MSPQREGDRGDKGLPPRSILEVIRSREVRKVCEILNTFDYHQSLDHKPSNPPWKICLDKEQYAHKQSMKGLQAYLLLY